MKRRSTPVPRGCTPAYYLGRPNTAYLARYANRTLLVRAAHELWSVR